MSNIVLVHGAWHGAWCWKRVIPLLRGAGHEVHAPTLTGLGERVHLASPQIGLDTHATDVVHLIEYEDLDDVVLVGHSYAGMVITAVAERIPQRLAQLVYLDAFLPEDGACLVDHVPAELVAGLEAAVRDVGEGWKAPPLFDLFGLTEPDDIAWVQRHLTFHPHRTNRDPVHRTNPDAAALPRAYLHCTRGGGAPLFAQFAAKARAEGLTVVELDTGHDAMVTAPADLVGALDAVMARDPSDRRVAADTRAAVATR